MAKTLSRIAAVDVDRLVAAKADKTVMHHDGGGLYLCVDRRGSASWMFRYTLERRARTMGLGAYPAVSLANARKAATAARSARAEGKDPLDMRDAERRARILARATKVTFKRAAEDFIASKQDEWRNAKHAAQWTSTLKEYAYPVIGNMRVQEVDNAAVLRVLQQETTAQDGKTKERLWTAKPETASRLRGRLEAVLGWATAGGLRTGDNPARWGGMLEHQLPAKSKLPKGKVTHHAALPIDQMHTFMRALRDADGMGARALEFAILTAARSGEVRGAKWGEIDLAAKVWTVPGSRMKAGRDHRVPLAPAAVTLLEALTKGAAADLVFPAPRRGMLSDMTLSAALKRMKVSAVPHGFRSTFRDWGAERTSYPGEMLEMALAHTVSDKVEAAYRRGDMFEKRRRLMTAWATFCSTPPQTVSGNVTPIQGKA